MRCISPKNRTIQNSIEFKASEYVLHDIRQVAAFVDLSRIKTRTWRQEKSDVRQVAALDFATFLWWVAYVHMLLYVVYVCAYVCEKVMFEVYRSESESMSDQYDFFLCF